MNQCKNEHWPALLKFSHRLHRMIPRRESTVPPNLVEAKYAAGLVFYRWAVAISRKLEDVLVQMRTKGELQVSGRWKNQKNVPFMYQGKIS